MIKLISCCGLDCATCDARTATINNDNELQQKTAEIWSKQYSAEITAEMINCTGCREEGVKFSHCNNCQIRNCVKNKNYNTCGDCNLLENCTIVGAVHQYVSDALLNLKSLN
jgi:hypothetical protein